VQKAIFWVLFIIVLTVHAAHCEDYSEFQHSVAKAIKSGQYDESLRMLDLLLKGHPEDPSLWTLRGLALEGKKNAKESLTSFDRAISIDKGFVPALEGALQTAYLHGDPRAARYALRLLAILPNNEVANAMAGALAYQSHDYSKCVNYFERSYGEVYHNENALSEFADCLLHQEMTGRVVEVLSTGLKLYPDSVQIKYNLAVVYLQAHEPTEAIQILAPLESERDSKLLNVLATAYTQAQLPDKALRILETAIAIDPNDETNYFDLAVLCLEHNQESNSVSAATAGITEKPNAASLYLIRGVAHAQLGEYDKAENDFMTARKIEPDQPHSTIAMSLLYSDRNQPDKEKELLDKQLKSAPKDAVANYMLADLLIRSGAEPGQAKFKKAMDYLAVSLASKPDSGEAQTLMGILLEKEGHDIEAVFHFEVALQVKPDDMNALYHAFRLLRKLHRNSEAEEILARLKSTIGDELRPGDAKEDMRVTSQASEQ
jgi:tetratricopeptide (TPR) repeat protein